LGEHGSIQAREIYAGRDAIFVAGGLLDRTPAVAPLHQIPPPPPDFVGRIIESNYLLQAFSQGCSIFGIQGLGGQGKTALALKFAEKLTVSFPDAQLYFDLQGGSNSPRSIHDALYHVVHSYVPDTKVDSPTEYLRNLYYTVLHHQNAIILMDNLPDNIQIEMLMPPSGCVLITTSRSRLTAPGIFVQELHKLPQEDAQSLLLKISPRIGDHAAAIANLCGYLPLALRVAGGVFAEYIDLTPAELISDLRSFTRILEPVFSSMILSYNHLSTEVQRAWRLLSMSFPSFDSSMAASLLSMSEDNTRELLRGLVKKNLVEWNPLTLQYGLHDLVRLFLLAMLTETDKEFLKTVAFKPGQCSKPRVRNIVAMMLDVLRLDNRQSLELTHPDYWATRIEPGSFVMGSDDYPFENDPERPAFIYTIHHPYSLGRYPVTNRQYHLFISDLLRQHKQEEAKSHQLWDWNNFAFPSGQGNYPVSCIKWESAYAFSRWANDYLHQTGVLQANERVRLPTEPEWERAAAYPVSLPVDSPGFGRHKYPWGNWRSFALHTNKNETAELGQWDNIDEQDEHWFEEEDLLANVARMGFIGNDLYVDDSDATWQLGKSAVGIFPHGVADCGAEELTGNVEEWCENPFMRYPLSEEIETEDVHTREDLIVPLHTHISDEETVITQTRLYILRGCGTHRGLGTNDTCAFRGTPMPYESAGNDYGFRLVRIYDEKPLHSQ